MSETLQRKSNNYMSKILIICPVYNEAIADNKKFIARPVDRMYPIGTPEDLDYFLNKVDPNGFL